MWIIAARRYTAPKIHFSYVVGIILHTYVLCAWALLLYIYTYFLSSTGHKASRMKGTQVTAFLTMVSTQSINTKYGTYLSPQKRNSTSALTRLPYTGSIRLVIDLIGSRICLCVRAHKYYNSIQGSTIYRAPQVVFIFFMPAFYPPNIDML